MRTVAQAGRLALSVGELVRLRLIVIYDTRSQNPSSKGKTATSVDANETRSDSAGHPPNTEVDESVFSGASVWPTIRTCCSCVSESKDDRHT